MVQACTQNAISQNASLFRWLFLRKSNFEAMVLVIKGAKCLSIVIPSSSIINIVNNEFTLF